MGTPYQYGSRRRRVMVLSSQPPSAPIDAVGSLALGDVVLSGSSIPVVDASGSLAIDALAASASAAVSVAATGGLAVDAVGASGSADLSVGASGVVAIDAVVFYSPPAVVDATGSLALDDLTAWGADYFPAATPRQVVVPTVSLRSQTGNRRRRVTIVTSITPNSSPVAGALALTRVVMARRFARPSAPPVSAVTTTQTRVVLGGPPPVHDGGGGSPKPLQSSWIAGAITPRHPKPYPRATVLHTRYVQPARDGLPNQITVATPHYPRQPHAGIVVHPAYKWGVNLGKTPNAPVVVRRPIGLRTATPIVVSSPPTSGLGFRPVVDPLVVHRPSRPWVRGHVVVLGLADARKHLRPPQQVVVRPVPKRSAPRVTSISTGDAFAIRPPRPPRPIIIPYNKVKKPRGLLMVLGFADAFEMPPPFVLQPTIVPFHPRPSDRRRPPLIVAAKTGVNPRSIPVFDPVVVARHVGVKASPWFYVSKANLLAPPPPPRRDPMSRVVVARVPRRRSPLMWPLPVVATSILQPDDQRYDKPWDLIAACIAWLRNDPRIVASFGDVKGSETMQKFVSDVELPRTKPPYAIFDEPMEVEHYESPDQDNRISSTVEGVFHLTVHGVEKLDVRRRADMVAASLQDAPLVFSDGVLMYLRRSERRFPIVTTPGVGANVTEYKRIVEFTYMIERFYDDRKV